MNKNFDIVTIGECLLELSTEEYFENTTNFKFSFGGDVIASTIAAKSFGANVGFITTIGDDYFKNTIYRKLNEYNINHSCTRVIPEKNGLYLLGQNDKHEFVTYRRRIASNYLGLEDYNEEYLNNAKIIYTTGITQSLSPQASQLVKKCFDYAKQNEIITAYDPNHTSAFMTNYDTKEYLEDLVQDIDIIFMSLKSDVEPIFGLSSVEKMINYFNDNGAKIIVIKSHPDNGYFVHNNGNTSFCDFYTENSTKYTKGAGDVFNGCFIAAYNKGFTPIEAAQLASKQAGKYMSDGQISKLCSYEDLMRD